MVVDWGGKMLEYYFGCGICVKPAGQAVPMAACDVLDFGTTTKTEAELLTFLCSATPRFTAATYDVLDHNCNHFSDELARFLTGRPVPEHILNMANEALSTPRGQALRGMLEGLEHSIHSTLNQHRHRLLRQCSRGLIMRQRAEVGAKETPTTPKTSPKGRDETRPADAVSGEAVVAEAKTDYLAVDAVPDNDTPNAVPHTATPDAKGMKSPASRLRTGVRASTIPDEAELAAFHAVAAAFDAAPNAGLDPAPGPTSTLVPPVLAENAPWRGLSLAEAPSHSEVSECGEDSELAAALMLETLEEQERRRQEWVAYYLGAGEVAEARALGWEGDGDSDGDTAAFVAGMVLDRAVTAEAVAADLVKTTRVERVNPDAISSAGIFGLRVPRAAGEGLAARRVGAPPPATTYTPNGQRTRRELARPE